MHWGDWNQMSEWWWAMALMMTAFWGFVIWAIVHFARRTAVDSPERRLRRRLADGDITEAEYDRLREVLHR